MATVADGVVTAVAAGTATITATATNGTADTSDDKTATCTVNVTEAATKYDVTLADGTEDAANWTICPASAEEGETVTIKYNGTKKVKSVKAVKKAAAPASLITNPAVGQFIGSDGRNYAADATLPDGVTKVAKIFYVGSDNGEAAPYNHGLALAMSDVNGGNACSWSSDCNATLCTFRSENVNELERSSRSARSDLPLQLCWLATEGTQESDRSGYKHLVLRDFVLVSLPPNGQMSNRKT